MNSRLPETLVTCHELIQQQNETIVQQQRQLERMQQQLERLLCRQYGRSSEQVHPDQQLLFAEPEADQATEEQGDADAEDESSAGKPRKPRRHSRQSLPAHLPRQRIEYELDESDRTCPCCGNTRHKIGEEVSEQLEYVPASLFVKQSVRFKYACRNCEEQVAVSPKPPQPIAKGLPGPGLLTQVILSKYQDHLPLYRQERIFARHGVHLARSSLCDWMARCADLLQGVYTCLKQQVLSSRIIQTDDTPVPVLDRNLDRTATGRFWVYRGDAAHPFVYYDFTADRKRAGPLSILEGFTGYLQGDAFSLYTDPKQDWTWVGCWAHARRQFFDAQGTHPVLALNALARIRQLYAVEKRAHDLAVAERQALRQQESRPVLAELRRWLETTEREVLPKSQLGQAIAYTLRYWEGLCRYCDDGELSIDNNASERNMRTQAVGRGNWLFAGSVQGGKTAAVLYSVLASIQRAGVAPFPFLRDLLTELPGFSGSDFRQFLPVAVQPA